VLSAVVSCAEGGSGLELWDCDVSVLDVQLPAGKFHTWMLTTVTNLTECFTQFVNARLQNCTSSEVSNSNKTTKIGALMSVKD
jgi:hypothetical protein